MKTFFITTYLLTFILFSCNQLKISEDETKGLNEIASLYGGNITYAIKWNTSTNTGRSKTFEIEIDNSDIINNNQKLTEMFASNIAYTFFKYSKTQKEKYDSILATVHFKEGGKATFVYNPDLLEVVDIKLKFVRQVVDILKSKKYDEISSTIKTGPVLLEENRIKYIEKLKSLDSTFGDIYDFTPSGLRISSGDKQKQILHISGSLKRSKADTQFSIDINSDSGQQEFYYIDYYF